MIIILKCVELHYRTVPLFQKAIPEIDDSKSEVALEHDHSEAQHIPVLSTTPLSLEKVRNNSYIILSKTSPRTSP